jgi:tetratricopeptide (TPR) repeat protein
MNENLSENSFTSILLRIIPQIKTRIQLSAFLATAVVFFLVRIAAPDNIPAQISAGMIGVCIIAFTLVFNFLNLFTAKDRPKVILTMFITFSFVVIALVVITGYLLIHEHDRASRENKQLAALSAIVENVKIELDTKERLFRHELDALVEKKRLQGGVMSFTEWKQLEAQEIATQTQLQTIQERKGRIENIKTQAGAIVDEVSKISKGVGIEYSSEIRGRATEAEAAFSAGDLIKAQELFRTMAKSGTDQTADANFWLGRLSELRADFAGAQRYYQTAADLAPENPKYIEALANCEMAVGDLVKAKADYERLASLFRNNPAQRTALVIALSDAATAARFLGELSTAERYFQEAFDIARLFEGGDQVAYAAVANDFAAYYVSIDRYQKADELYRVSLMIYESRGAKLAFRRVDVLNNLGRLQMLLGHYDQAQSLLKEALDLERETVGANAPLYAISTANLANVYAEKGELHEAELRYITALEIIDRTVGKDHSRYGRISGLYAELLLLLGQVEKADAVAKKSKENLIRNFGNEHEFVAQAYIRSAEVSIERHNSADAFGDLARAEAIAGKRPEAYASLLARINRDKGIAASIGGESKIAEECFIKAIDMQQNTYGMSNPELAKTLLAYATFLIADGKGALAQEPLQRAFDIASATLASNHPIFVVFKREQSLMAAK